MTTLLFRMRKWRCGEVADERIESSIVRRIDNVDAFPDERIVDEFCRERDVPTSANSFIWHLPNLPRFQVRRCLFAILMDNLFRNLCWHICNGLMSIVLQSWCQWWRCGRCDGGSARNWINNHHHWYCRQSGILLHFRVIDSGCIFSIVKRRVRCGQPCFEVQWKKIGMRTLDISHTCVFQRPIQLPYAIIISRSNANIYSHRHSRD